MSSSTEMKANAIRADGLPYNNNWNNFRSVILLGCHFMLQPVKFGQTFTLESLTGFVILNALSFPQGITMYVDDYLVKRGLGWRGVKGVTKWALPLVELLQLVITWNLYRWTSGIAQQRTDIVDLTKFRIGSTVPLASSIISFVWMTGVFCYFNFIRMSRTPHRYEPVHQPPGTTEAELLLLFPSPRSSGAPKSSISALAKAFEFQCHQGLDIRRRLSLDNVHGYLNTVAIKPPSTHLKCQPSLSPEASSTVPHFHPHQIAWDGQRSGLFFRLGMVIICCSAIGLIDNGVQMLGCDDPWQLFLLKCLLAWHSAIFVTIITSLVLVVRQATMMHGLGRSLARVYLSILRIIGIILPVALIITAKAPSVWIGGRAAGVFIYSNVIMLWDRLLFNLEPGEIERVLSQ